MRLSRKFISSVRLLWCGLALAAAPPAAAHDPFEISARAHLRPDTLELYLTMARSTALSIATGKAESPSFEPEEFAQYHPGFVTAAPRLFLITAGGRPLALRSVQVTLGPEYDIDFHLIYPAPPAGPLRFEARHLGLFTYGYGDVLSVQSATGDTLGAALLTKEEPALEVALPGTGPAVAAPPPPAPAPAPAKQFAPFLKLGVKHILTGHDHLLFLVGLLVACRRFRSMFVIITCFTLAHSITLALAAFGVVAIPGRIVEPLIAASIVFVGVENLLRRDEPPHRWLLTLLFGLIHGFGFAGALREAGLGQSGAALGVPLFSFNLGVELGQLGVVAVVFPLLGWLRERPAYVRLGRPALSAVVAVAGTCWLLQRTIFA